ncbi:MAG: hypothetical protein AAGF71_08325 [Pseudomonadota bacterium]
MDKELRSILADPAISDSVKAALIPELTRKREPSGISKLLNNGPMIAALASVLTLGISELVKLNLAEQKSEETIQLDTSDKQHEQSLERLKFQFDVIRSALDDTKSLQDRAETLLFLTEVELLDGLNGEKLQE